MFAADAVNSFEVEKRTEDSPLVLGVRGDVFVVAQKVVVNVVNVEMAGGSGAQRFINPYCAQIQAMH